MKDTFEARAKRAIASMKLVHKIKRLLEGKSSDVVGVVLADLTSLWIAGHVESDGDEEATAAMQELVLRMHVDVVRQLIPIQFQAQRKKRPN